MKKKYVKPFRISLIIIALLLLYGLVAHSAHLWPFHRTLTSSTLDATRNEQTTHPSPKNNNPPTKKDVSTSSTGNQTSEQVPVSTAFAASITELSETDHQINFKAVVQNTTTAGTCVVTFSNPNDRPVTQQFNATNRSGTSTCGPTAIPTQEFSYVGTWQVSFHYYVGDQQATAQSEINIQ